MITHEEAIEIIEGLPHTMKVPLRRMIKHAQIEHELLGLYRRRPLYINSVQLELKFKQKPKPKLIAPERDTKTVDMFSNLSDSQIKTYSSILSKLHSISDLADNKDYPAFAMWIGNILRDPTSVREETAKRIFKALRTETDFKG